MDEVKEVAMDVPVEQTGGRTRRRRGAGRRRRTARASSSDDDVQEGGAEVGVERVGGGETAPAPPKPATVQPNLAPFPAPKPQAGGAVPAKPPVVVIAPAKKKPAKVMLVPKSTAVRVKPKKTFKVRKVRVSVDNSAKTMKRRHSILSRIDSMPDADLRAKAVAIRLSRAETVAKVPVPLLRQMVRDYYTMRGNFL